MNDITRSLFELLNRIDFVAPASAVLATLTVASGAIMTIRSVRALDAKSKESVLLSLQVSQRLSEAVRQIITDDTEKNVPPRDTLEKIANIIEQIEKATEEAVTKINATRKI
jgi:phosphoribosylformylglycinamidine (FGAM) synthase-like enzyme